MNIKKLNSIIELRAEVESIEKEIEKRLNNSYIKGVGTNFNKTNKISNPTLNHTIEELELPILLKYLEEHKQKCLEEIEKLTTFILNIYNIQVRRICTLKYIYGVKSWGKIAIEIGGGNTPDSVRKAYERYFRQSRIENKLKKI